MVSYAVTQGEYLIEAEAVPTTPHAPTDGYVAAVAVSRPAGGSGHRETVFHARGLDGGRIWATPDRALRHAVREAQRVIRAAGGPPARRAAVRSPPEPPD